MCESKDGHCTVIVTAGVRLYRAGGGGGVVSFWLQLIQDDRCQSMSDLQRRGNINQQI